MIFFKCKFFERYIDFIKYFFRGASIFFNSLYAEAFVIFSITFFLSRELFHYLNISRCRESLRSFFIYIEILI
jgi:hypothetical protein